MTLKIRIKWLFSVDSDSDLFNLVTKFIQDSWNDKIIICDKTDEDYDLVLRVKKIGTNRNVPQQQKHNKPVMYLLLRDVVQVDRNLSDDENTYLFYTKNQNPLLSWIWGKYKKYIPTTPRSYEQSRTHLNTFFKKNYHKSTQPSPRDGVGGQVSFVVGMVAAVVLMAVSTIVDNNK